MPGGFTWDTGSPPCDPWNGSREQWAPKDVPALVPRPCEQVTLRV